MKNKKIIGILGGMGPSASGYLYSMINKLAVTEYGARKNDDFPETILYSVPVPDFISSNKNKNKAMIMLKSRVKKMNTFPISVMGIACNTAHILLPELQRVSHAKFVSMVDEVSLVIARKKIKKIGILATSSTIRALLYQKSLEKHDVTVFVPNSFDQLKIDVMIRKLVSGKITVSDKNLLIAIAENLRGQNGEAILLGCTELPLVFPKIYPLPVINSVEVLARALLRESYGEVR